MNTTETQEAAEKARASAELAEAKSRRAEQKTMAAKKAARKAKTAYRRAKKVAKQAKRSLKAARNEAAAARKAADELFLKLSESKKNPKPQRKRGPAKRKYAVRRRSHEQQPATTEPEIPVESQQTETEPATTPTA